MFTPTQYHFLRWIENNRPAIFNKLQLPVKASLDNVINKRADIKPNYDIDNALNLLSLVRSNIRRGARKETLTEYLRDFDSMQHPKRYYYFKRVYRHLLRVKSKNISK